MDLEPDWYAYQCKSGEVLFYYNSVSGEHRWAMHFCSCLNSKSGQSPREPCCLWEPVKSQSSESGKFVRSIGTETEDQYFTDSIETKPSLQAHVTDSIETKHSSQAHITFEYSVSEDRMNRMERGSGSGYSGSDEPVDVVLDDPFLPVEHQHGISSKRMTLKLNELSRDEFLLTNHKAPQHVNKQMNHVSPLQCGDYDAMVHLGHKHDRTQDGLYSNIIAIPEMTDSQFSSQPSLSHTDVPLSTAGQDFAENSSKRQKGSASTRKNPEPRKLLMKRSNLDMSDEDDHGNNSRFWVQERKDIDTQLCSPDNVVVVEPADPSPSSPSSSYPQDDGNQDDGNQDDMDEQVCVCALCGKDFATAAMLTSHLMKHQPTGTTCPICNKYFSRRQGLRYHVQTHSGDKPHVCQECHKTFTKSASLVAHVRTHSGVRPFKCPKCNKGFTHSSNLSSHLRIHSSLRPYQCRFCSKGFKTSSHLSLHLRSHSDERPYECSDCGKSFKNTSHLRSHEKLHLAPKSVYCTGCDEGFRSFSHLMYHHQTNPQCIKDNEQQISYPEERENNQN